MYRTGTYVAFDGGGDTSVESGDIKYFNLLKAWNKSNEFVFEFSDSHQKTYQVKDDSKKSTLQNRLMERMSKSKNFLLVLTKDTNLRNQNLNWEIEKAFERGLPFIVCYPGYLHILNPKSHSEVWPSKLKEYIIKKKLNCVHIPFKEKPISLCVKRYSVVSGVHPKSALGKFGRDQYNDWGLI